MNYFLLLPLYEYYTAFDRQFQKGDSRRQEKKLENIASQTTFSGGKIIKIDVERTMSLTKRVPKRIKGLRALRGRKLNLPVYKFSISIGKIKAASKYSFVGIVKFSGVKHHSEISSFIKHHSALNIMSYYKNKEYADTHLMYGLKGDNGHLAQRMYREEYPRRRCSHNTTFTNINQRLRETGFSQITKHNIRMQCANT